MVNTDGKVSKDTTQPKPKRKKTSRACIHCQRAHVTCDDGRPCQRCVKKGCQDSCHDGVRKQAKYLQDVDVPHENRSKGAVPNLSASMELPGYLPPTPPDGASNRKDNNQANRTQSQPQIPPQHRYEQQQQPQSQQNQSSSMNIQGSPLNPGAGNTSGYSPENIGQYDFGSKAANLEYSILSNILRTTGEPPLGSISEGSDVSMLTNTMNTPDSDSPNMSRWNGSHDYHPLPTGQGSAQHQQYSPSEHDNKQPEEVYSKVTAPYPYTQGYHALISYLRSRFNRKQLLHMAQAMAAYRPSFIATTKTLKEEDLIFMEMCFQRTLLEFEKFISASGTPTVVWRRTGQIAAVGKEFCILTQWSKERLLSTQTFIVELMDDSSVTRYFDLFSHLAFGDSRGVTMSECTLLKPSGEKVPAACTWTVKRDVFDIPMMIIGNFLPILS